jgi:hypothetical protein
MDFSSYKSNWQTHLLTRMPTSGQYPYALNSFHRLDAQLALAVRPLCDSLQGRFSKGFRVAYVPLPRCVLKFEVSNKNHRPKKK